MFLFFDVETNGLPKDYKKPPSTDDNWPRTTQIAWQRYDITRELVNEKSFIIKPDGWTVPKTEFFIENNISTERCEKEGVPLEYPLGLFGIQLTKCRYLMSHNMLFDYSVVASEMMRHEMKIHFKDGKKPKKICTKEEGTGFCQIPNPHKWAKNKYKWPKLEELHQKLFEEDFKDAHDALGDVKALAKCFFEMVDQKIIKL